MKKINPNFFKIAFPKYGEELKTSRISAGLSLDQLAKEFGTYKAKIHRIERSEVCPDVKMIQKIEDKFGIDVDHKMIEDFAVVLSKFIIDHHKFRFYLNNVGPSAIISFLDKLHHKRIKYWSNGKYIEVYKNDFETIIKEAWKFSKNTKQTDISKEI